VSNFPVSNLLTQVMEDYRIMNHVRVDDDFGGHAGGYTEGKTIRAAVAKNASPEQALADKDQISEVFTMVVEQGVTLGYHEVLKRVSDGAIFRTTSRTKDSTAHPASTVKISVVSAERWELPT